MSGKNRLSRAALLDELLAVRPIVAGALTICLASMRPCIFKWLRTFLKGSPLAFNLHLILPGISCESHNGAKFTTRASEMERRVPREFADRVLVSDSAFGHGLSF